MLSTHNAVRQIITRILTGPAGQHRPTGARKPNVTTTKTKS